MRRYAATDLKRDLSYLKSASIEALLITFSKESKPVAFEIKDHLVSQGLNTPQKLYEALRGAYRDGFPPAENEAEAWFISEFNSRNISGKESLVKEALKQTKRVRFAGEKERAEKKRLKELSRELDSPFGKFVLGLPHPRIVAYVTVASLLITLTKAWEASKSVGFFELKDSIFKGMGAGVVVLLLSVALILELRKFMRGAWGKWLCSKLKMGASAVISISEKIAKGALKFLGGDTSKIDGALDRVRHYFGL